MAAATVTITLRVPPEVYERAKAEAKRFGLSLNAYTLGALARRADENQDFDAEGSTGRGLHV